MTCMYLNLYTPLFNTLIAIAKVAICMVVLSFTLYEGGKGDAPNVSCYPGTRGISFSQRHNPDDPLTRTMFNHDPVRGMLHRENKSQ